MTEYSETADVLHLDDEGDRGLLRKLFAPPGTLGGIETTAITLLQILRSAKTVIVEKFYRDVDYSASYARLYHKRHHDMPRRCVRLHFLSIHIDPAQISSMLFGDSDVRGQVQDSYLGFCVCRPLKECPIGRTVLHQRLLEATGNANDTLTCLTSYKVNLFGNPISFPGVPWIQQDGLVFACASAAMWVVAYYMAHRFAPEFRVYTTAEITDLACQHPNRIGRAIPSSGLTLEQMLAGLDRMGFDAVPVSIFKVGEARRHIYHNIESGLPVIISLAAGAELAVGHAVTVVGHGLDEGRNAVEDPDILTKTGLHVASTSEFVPHFIVQDDQLGPFTKLFLMDSEEARKDESIAKKLPQYGPEGCDCVAVLECGGETAVYYLYGVTIPYPRGIFLDGIDAERNAVSIIHGYYNDLNYKPDSLLLFRTFLQPSNELKQQWNADRGRPPKIGRLISGHSMSRWVWVTEVSTLDLLQTDETLLGQVIQDCAGRAYDISPSTFLMWHMPTVLFYSYPDSNDSYFYDVNYQPYKRLDRRIKAVFQQAKPAPLVNPSGTE